MFVAATLAALGLKAGGVNPDGHPSLSVHTFVGSPFEQRTNGSYRDLYFNKDVTTRYQRSDTYVPAYGAALEAELPLFRWYTLGLIGAIHEQAWHWSEQRDEQTYTSPPPLTVTARLQAAGYYIDQRRWITVTQRFHTSGKEWSRPASEGGSPWGRVWHPSFYIDLAFEDELDNWGKRRWGFYLPAVGVQMPVHPRAAIAYHGGDPSRPMRRTALDGSNQIELSLAFPWLNQGRSEQDLRLAGSALMGSTWHEDLSGFQLRAGRGFGPRWSGELVWTVNRRSQAYRDLLRPNELHHGLLLSATYAFAPETW